MLKNVLLGFASGAAGGIANVLFLIVAGLIGLNSLMGLELPSFASNAFLYKQVFWGGVWALAFLLPIMPKQWLIRAGIIAVAAASVTFFILFPMATTDGQGPGVAGLNIGPLMPVYVLLADLTYGLVASKVYELVQE